VCTIDQTEFVYYIDATPNPSGNTGQWVQIQANAAIDTALTNRVTAVETQTVPTGSLFPFAGAASPAGYALCTGASVSTSGTYANLFSVIGYTYGGSGASFNLPDLTTRIPVGYQAPVSLGTATITIAAPGVVTRATHGLATGNIVYFTTTGALPTGITATTGRYWVIVLTSSTFRLASSLANALAGTAITTSGSQSGTHTVFSADFELGRSNGEESHRQTETELVAHTHGNADGNASNFISAGGGDYGVQYSANLTGSTGGGLPTNNMQPYLTTNYIIKL
jgi:microcystin-dependent protein